MTQEVQYSRFDTQDIAHPPCFISVLPVGLTDRVDVVDTEYPFVLLKLDLPAKVVQMPDQGAENFSVSGFCVGAHKVNDMLCEVGVEFAVIVGDSISADGTVSSHEDVNFLWRGNEESYC
jgi:hypothetical protein